MYDAGKAMQIHHYFCTASNYSATTGFYLILFLDLVLLAISVIKVVNVYA
jgi:hypothetical protein